MVKAFAVVWIGLMLLDFSAAASNEVVIVGLSSSRVLSGVVEIPIELHAQTNVEIEDVYFFLDGEPSSSIWNPDQLPPKPPILGHWLTTAVSNGWHTLQAFAEYPDHSSCGHDKYSSPTIRVQVFNPIVIDTLGTYGGLDTGVPFAFPIKAFVAATNATWKVTISTRGILVSSSNGTLNVTISTNSSRILRVLTGTTTNGTIDATWDRKDSNGISVLPAAVDFEVETTPIDGSAKSVEHRIATLEGRSGQPDGQGSITFPDGTKYVGEFRNGQFNGQGTFTWPTGSIQHGEWRDDNPYRVSGVDIGSDGTKEVGTWNYDGTKSGGTITWKDGREYKGDWKIVDGGTDLPDGRGKMTYPDGKVEEGLWKDGKFAGVVR